jgi:hypothetical protein
MDLLGPFVTARCVTESAAQSTSASLYKGYLEWCTKEDEPPVNRTVFARALIERGAKSIRTGDWHGWQGIRLKGPDDDPPDWISDPNDTSDVT